MNKRYRKKKYILDMFPYPSGDGLHVGHVESYTATDILSRYYRMQGFEVLHPQGWDAFGLPAENYAIKTRVHPKITTARAIATFKSQMQKMGFSYDWDREINSSDPAYYKWTQWFFLLLYKNGYAYRAKAKVNFCSKCQTVLANEQVIAGKCERCESEVVQKDLEQWFFKITDFIEDNYKEAKLLSAKASSIVSGLISGLDKIDWPESTKAAQKNWIGRSEGAIIKFEILVSNLMKNPKSGILNPKQIRNSNYPNSKQYLEVFTTRLDTIYGCTYCVIAPEHDIVESLLKIKNQKSKIENIEEIRNYVTQSQNKTELQRMEQKEKSGVEIKGLKAVNPFTQEKVPVFVADYVLGHYGTGAVMAVPAHDSRDYEFATKYGLAIKRVIIKAEGYKMQKVNLKMQNENIRIKEVYVDDGILINSEKYSGLTSEKARQEMVKWLEENNLGGRKINYKIRDWLVSRQRYWGAPIPIIYCRVCGEKIKNQKSKFKIADQNVVLNKTIINGTEYAIIPVPENQLPVRLPDDVDFKPTGESPLKYSKSFHKVTCPVCDSKAMRESDTMDTFVCSSWYYFRYTDPRNEKEFASKEKIKKWLPVDIYVGGTEHSVLHLLYSRFFTKVLCQLGYIDFDEPFLKLRHQGIILAENGQKMSKSKGNVINPDEVVKEYGADALRMFEMFMGPLEDAKPWNTKGIVGIKRFLDKINRLAAKVAHQSGTNGKQTGVNNLLHKTIKKVTEDIENFRFNTAISQLMILANAMENEKNIPIANYKLLITLVGPFAPHTAEEIWSRLGHQESIFKEKWPAYDPKLTKDERVELVIQVNGKARQTLEVAAGLTQEEAERIALAQEKIQRYLAGQRVLKVIFIKDKLINLVI